MVLSLDIGTSLLKAALFDLETKKLIASHTCPLKRTLNNAHADWWEIAPQQWLTALQEILSRFHPHFNHSKNKALRSIVIGANGPSLVRCDAHGNTLGNALSWIDQRDKSYAEQLGGATYASFPLSRMLYFAKEQPEEYQKTRYFFTIESYLNFILTKEAYTILPASDFTPLYWSDECGEKYQLDKEKLPPIIFTGEFVGLTQKTDLFPQIPAQVKVFAGGPDYTLALLGSAATSPGRVCDRTGSSEAINLCDDKAWNDSTLMSHQHVVAPYYNIAGMLNNAGSAISWYKNISHPQLDYENYFNTIIQDTQAGAKKLLFLPYLTGERFPFWDNNAKGAFIGLQTHHDSNDFSRSVLEATLYSVRDILTEMQKKVSISEIRVTGNLSNNDAFNQLRANICRVPVWVSDLSHSELRGGLVIALYGLGYYDSLQESSEACFQLRKVFEPHAQDKQIYDEMYAIFTQAYPAVKSIFHRL